MSLPQRVLVYELRIAIDRAMAQPRFEQAVWDLVYENPRGWQSSHVRHNLGVRRRAWLAASLNRRHAR